MLFIVLKFFVRCNLLFNVVVNISSERESIVHAPGREESFFRQWRILLFSLLTSPNISWREIFGRFSKGGEGLWTFSFQENSMQGIGSLVL